MEQVLCKTTKPKTKKKKSVKEPESVKTNNDVVANSSQMTLVEQNKQTFQLEVENKEDNTDESSKTDNVVYKVENIETKTESDFTRLLMENKNLSKIIEIEQEQIPAFQPAVTTPKQKVGAAIRPYTESQLAALYTNSELDTLDQFNSQFIEAELKGLTSKQHSLYDLLLNYLQVRSKVVANTIELEQLRKEYSELQSNVWTTDSVNFTGRGQCQDFTVVTTTYTYQKATLHRSVFQSIVRILGLIRKLTYENHVLYSYSAEDLRLQIELFIQTTINTCMTVSGITANSPVIVSMQNEPLHLKPYLGEIRLCISVLFAFQRKLVRDEQFLKETREWLNRLIAVLLRLATYQDHLFILNHILRCPAGVGGWAAQFIQAPLSDNPTESPFSNYQINHILSIFAIILMPIKEREKFLEDINQVKEDDAFVMVDSEGEEDDDSGTGLRENDLVALLSQLPLEGFFRSILLVEKRNFENTYQGSRINEHHIFRFFAFSTVLLKIIQRGLQTYNQPRYNQFSKRLSRFIRHIVQYATDQWEQFRSHKSSTDEAMMERLQVEYDQFFLRAIYCLYSAQKLGAWQFLAVVPYNLIKIGTVWKIYNFLHELSGQNLLTDDLKENKNIWEVQFRQNFEEKLSSLADDELYYLLNTFANIALARERDDMEFIVAATTDLLHIGFINENTQEICSKSARTLLTHLTSKYPELLSIILKNVQDNLEKMDTLALYLYEELPLTIWQFSDDDLEIIVRFLYNEITTTESKLARMILSRLNYDILPYDLHCEIALLVLKISEQDTGYLGWAWQTVLRLKLHIYDGAFDDIKRVLEPDNYEIITKGIRENQPLASFVSLLMTTWGHLVPTIWTNGLQQLLFLQSHGKYEAVLFALYLIVPLFINSQEYIINNEQFQEIIVALINADRGYISMAKTLIGSQSTVLQQFGNMIETQLVNFSKYGLDSPRLLVRLWTNALVSIPTWSRDAGIMYLLDLIIKASFFHSDALDVVRTILKDLQQNNSPQEQSVSISSIFKWVSSSNANGAFISGSLVNSPWLAYLVIDIEFEEKEFVTGFWKELLVQLNNQKGKVNVDAAIKKATSKLRLPVFTSTSLGIYRWAQQALDTPVDHPLLPLLWQKFFTLYLTRLSVAESINDIACIGSKFFDGLVNFAFFKRLKKKLQEIVDYYDEATNFSEDDSEEKKLFRQNCSRVFKAFSLWLEEPRLQKTNLLLQSLPPVYQSNLLGFIIQGQTSPWLEYVNYDAIKEAQIECIKNWNLNNFRHKKNINKPLLNPGNTTESPDPVVRILRRLTVYENPKEAPPIKHCAPTVPVIDLSSKEAMFQSLEPCFKSLKQFAHNQTLKLSEHKALDCSYQELIPQLYRTVLNKVTRKVACRGRQDASNCSGAGIITIEVQESRVNERIEHLISTNRHAFESLLIKILQTPALQLCVSSVSIQQAIKVLQSQLRCNPATAELGIELFYYILSLINEETNSYLPTKTLFVSCLEKLGQSHICGVEIEMPRLVQKILKEPTLGGYLAPHFSPGNVGTVNLLFMYKQISQEIGTKYDITFALLSKFDIENWLRIKNPKLIQRSEFMQTVIKALTTLGYEPSVDSLILHGLYRRHLLNVFEFQFPEHYGEVLIYLLKASNANIDTNLLSKTVWFDILNFLTRPMQIDFKMSLRDQLRRYAQSQKILQHQELLDTVDLFSKHFTQERLQYGLYGLYPKCRNYIDIYVILLGMTGHGLIVSALNVHQGVLGEKLCQIIWPSLINMFAPWIVPYSMQHLKDNMASWIQQLADDRSILLPWIPTDVPLAQKFIAMFFECIHFLIDTLPACNNVLNFIWQWYVTCFAHTSVKDHILQPIHQSFLGFPWDNFWPSLSDLECMLRVIDQYLPECHSFLGHIFVSIPWVQWLNNINNSPSQIKSRIYQCYLNLLIKLSNEPNVRHRYTNKIKSLLVESENFDWNIVDGVVLQHVLDWYVMSCNPKVILASDPMDLDFRVFLLLRIVSGYNLTLEQHCQTLQNKRLIFVKSHMKLFSVYINKNKATVTSNQSQLSAIMTQQLHHLEAMAKTQDEFNSLLHEILGLINMQTINKISVECFEKWIINKLGDSNVIKGIFKVLGNAVNCNEAIGALLETSIISYFQNNVTESFNPSWEEIRDNIVLNAAKQTELEKVLVNNGCILGLSAILMQRIHRNNDSGVLLNLVTDWLAQIKISENIEPKIIVLWHHILRLSLIHCEKDETSTALFLYNFAKMLIQISQEKSTSRWSRGLLTAIGITKQETISINFRFLCKALAGYILAQLPEMKGDLQIVRHHPNAPARVGQPGGNTECTKVLMTLDCGQNQGKIKECEELVLNQIQNSENSMHNVSKFLNMLVKQFYMKPYLKDIG